MSVHVRTANGLVTSYREAWKSKVDGRPVYVWRTDGRDDTVEPFDPNVEPTLGPLDFGSVEQAERWIDEVWQGSTQKERDEAHWTVES